MKKDDCIFCKLANGSIPTNTLYEDEDFRVILGTGNKGTCIDHTQGACGKSV